MSRRDPRDPDQPMSPDDRRSEAEESSFLDLPLGTERGGPNRQESTREEPERDKPERAESGRGGRDPRGRPGEPPGEAKGEDRRRDRGTASAGRRSRRRLAGFLLAALALVAVGALVGYLWPRGTPAVLRTSETLLELGEGAVGATGTPRELVVTNAGTRTARVESVALVGESPEDFRLVADGCSGRELPGSAQCTVLVALAPQVAPDGGEPGPRSATLEVVGSFGNSPLEVPLLGTVRAPLLALDRGQLAFGSVPAESRGEPRTVTARNRGTAALELGRVSVEGPGAETFLVERDRCSGRTLRPGGSCTLAVVFAPVVEGPEVATLVVPGANVGSGRVELTGTGAPPRARLTVPDRARFGAAPVGGSGVGVTVEVVNPGRRSVQVRRAEIEGPDASTFEVQEETCTTSPVEPAGHCTVRVVFAPEREGTHSATLAVLFGEARVARVPLEGEGVEGRLIASPASVSFRDLRPGGSDTRSLELSNTGSGAVTVERLAVRAPVARGGGAGAFTVRGDCNGELAPGATCRLEVRFEPPGEGSFEARLVVIPAATGSGALEVPLQGRATEPRLEVSPAAPSFGTVPLGQARTLTVAVRSVGSAALSLDGFRLEGPDADRVTRTGGSCRPGMGLSPGAACDLELRYEPRRPGDLDARLVLEHDGANDRGASDRGAGDADGLRRVELRGRGEEPPRPRLAVRPEALRFGSREMGSRSGIETLTLENPGNARLLLRELTLAGPHPGDFQLVAGTCDGLPFLAPGGDCTVGVRFVPTAEGSRRAVIVVRHDAGDGVTRVPLSGTGSSGGAGMAAP